MVDEQRAMRYLDNVPEVEDIHPYEMRTSVGSAKYVPPSAPAPPRPKVINPLTYEDQLRAEAYSRRAHAQGYKTEKWREHGMERWPENAHENTKQKPSQFMKAEEIVPLQRTIENPQPDIKGELWSRSLRTRGLGVQHIGMNNQNVATSAVRCLFDREGQGWTGKTNTRRTTQLKGAKKPQPGNFGPFIKDWVEKPVAVGKMGANHMGGSRYHMNLSPRPCVPKSMGVEVPLPPGPQSSYLDKGYDKVPMTAR